jgi:hypothetical protein
MSNKRIIGFTAAALLLFISVISLLISNSSFVFGQSESMSEQMGEDASYRAALLYYPPLYL